MTSGQMTSLKLLKKPNMPMMVRNTLTPIPTPKQERNAKSATEPKATPSRLGQRRAMHTAPDRTVI